MVVVGLVVVLKVGIMFGVVKLTKEVGVTRLLLIIIKFIYILFDND